MEVVASKRRISRFFLLGSLVGIGLVLTLSFRPAVRIRAPLLEQMVLFVVVPVESAAQRLSRVVVHVFGLYRIVKENQQLVEENRQLRQRLIELEGENRQLRRYVAENHRLRRLLELAPHLPEQRIAAEVIAATPSNWFQTATLNRGEEHGLQVGDVVVVYEGVVGQIVRVARRSSTVLLLVDRRSGVGVKIKRTGAIGFLRGTGKGTCLLKILSRGAELRMGDVVLTSGLGGIYPAGLRVGRVVKVLAQPYSQTPEGIVEPFVNFADLHEVFIIPRGKGGGQ